MRIFKKPNISDNWKCPVCGKNDEKEVALIGVDGTADGRNMEAVQVHVDCINLTYSPFPHFLYQYIKEEE